MDQEFQRLLNMHDMAARFGDGLKPELHELLIGRRQIESETVRLLDAPLASSGPAHHDLSPSKLDELGIPVLDRTRATQQAKDGTDG